MHAKLSAALLLIVPITAASAAAQHEFDTWTGYDVGSYPQAFYVHAVDVADVDGDGDLDAVTALGFNGGWVTVARNRGDGSYAPPTSTALPTMSEGVTTLDVDLDGDTDVVASQGGANGNGTKLALLRNQGAGTFAAPQLLELGAAGPVGVVSADFDNNGWPDIAAAIYGFIGQGEQVAVLLNDEQGGFEPASLAFVPTQPSSLTGPYRLAAGDMDGDGAPDLVAALDGNRVAVLLNDGDGTFGSGVAYAAFLGTQVNIGMYADAALADADHDGDLDVYYGSTNSGVSGTSDDSGGVMLLRNTGAGVLTAPTAIDLPTFMGGPSALEVGDVTGDGWVDVVSVQGSSSGWVFLEGDGAGGFLPGLAIPSGEYPKDVRIADADGNGALDMLVVNRHSLELTVHPWGEGPGGEGPVGEGPGGGFHAPQPFAVQPLSGDMDAADMDGDGDLDAAASWDYAGGGGISVLRGHGDGSFAPYVHYAGPRGAMDVKFRNLDADGDLDLLWCSADSSPPYDFHYRLNDGAGNFGPAVTVPVGTCGNGGVEAFDMDHDGDLDVFLSDYLGCAGGGTSSVVWVSRNKGNATFDPPYALAFLLDPELVDHGDFNADGHEDLLVTQTNLVAVRLGNGDGTFGAPIYAQTPWAPKGLFVGDLDLDGKLDVATCNWAGDPQQNMAVLIGRGDGSFKPPVLYVVSMSTDFGGPVGIAGGDVDGDLDLDLLVGNYGSNDASYFRNKGDGKFEPHVRFGVGEAPTDLVLGDFTGDGVDDLAALVHDAPYALDKGVAIVRGTGALGAAWTNLGFGLAGSLGTPTLGGGGSLLSGSSVTLAIHHALPFGTGALILGLTRIDAPFKGGILVPKPDILAPLSTGGAGALLLTTVVPAGVPAGTVLFLQAWLTDPAAPSGLSATNAVQGVFP
jgi:hypothetical protein